MVSDIEEHKLRVFERRVLRNVSGSKRDEVRGGWRKLHNKELHDLYSSSSTMRIIKSRRMTWVGHGASMGENRKCIYVISKKARGKETTRKTKMYVDNIKMDLLEIGLGGVDWTGLAQDRYGWGALVNAVMNLRAQ
jgi:hypothetical protein